MKKIDPNFKQAYLNNGIGNTISGNRQEAVIDFSMAIKIDPKHVEAYTNLGILKQQMGDTSGAII